MARVNVEAIIENTTMEKYINSSGRELVYYITPNEGYALHHNARDVYDEETKETIYGFSTASVSVPVRYDFESNPNNIFAILESEVNNYQTVEDQ